MHTPILFRTALTLIGLTPLAVVQGPPPVTEVQGEAPLTINLQPVFTQQAIPLVSVTQTTYDYSPQVVQHTDGSQTMFFGSMAPQGGDAIYQATRPDATQQWSVQSTAVLLPGGTPQASGCVNDPSAIITLGTTYLYFTCAPTRPMPPGTLNNAICMVASSNGGQSWTVPVVIARPQVAVSDGDCNGTSYGAGQPSVTYNPDDGYYYMLYTDTTASPRSGELVLRATSPAFIDAQNLGMLDPDDAWGGCNNADWAYNPATKQFVLMETTGMAPGAVAHFLTVDADGHFTPLNNPGLFTSLEFREGGGSLTRREDGTLVVKTDGTVQVSGSMTDPAKAANDTGQGALYPDGINPWTASIAIGSLGLYLPFGQ